MRTLHLDDDLDSDPDHDFDGYRDPHTDLAHVFARVFIELDALKVSVSEVSRAATANANLVVDPITTLDDEVLDLDKTVRHAA